MADSHFDAFREYMAEPRRSRYWIYLAGVNRAQRKRLRSCLERLDESEMQLQRMLAEVQAISGDRMADVESYARAIEPATNSCYALLDSIHELMVVIENLVILAEACMEYGDDPIPWLCKNSHHVGALRAKFASLPAESVRRMLGLESASNNKIFADATDGEQPIVEKYLADGIQRLGQHFGDLLEFFEDWKIPYQKYKHAPVEDAGHVSIQSTRSGTQVAATATFLKRGNDAGGEPTYESIIIPANQNSLNRVRGAIIAASQVHETILSSQVLYHVNLGRSNHVPPFAFDVFDPVKEDQVTRLREALETLAYVGGTPEDYLTTKVTTTYTGDAKFILGDAFFRGRPATFGYDVLADTSGEWTASRKGG